MSTSNTGAANKHRVRKGAFSVVVCAVFVTGACGIVNALMLSEKYAMPNQTAKIFQWASMVSDSDRSADKQRTDLAGR